MRSGTRTPAAAALLAASGPATPSIAPSRPNSSRLGDEAPLDHVREERRDLGAAGGQGADREAEERAPEPRLPGPAQSSRVIQRAARQRVHEDLAAAVPARHVDRLADREEPDQDDDQLHPVQQLRRAERQPRLPGLGVDAHDAEGEAAKRDTKPRTLEAPRTHETDVKATHHEREVVGGPEHEGQLGHRRRREGQHDGGERAGDERADRRGGEGGGAPAAPRHAVALEGRHDRAALARACSAGSTSSSRRTSRRRGCPRT